MSHSTASNCDHQYLHAFRQLFPTRLLKRAVACRRRATRDRQLPLYLLLGTLLTWFFKPAAGLPALLCWLRRARHRTPTEPAL